MPLQSDLKTAVTEGTYSGTLASFETGFRPQKIVQFEPVPKVIETSLTLAWHIAPCYTNKMSGFDIDILQGKPTLTNDWQDVEFDEPGDTNRFFRVNVTW